MPEAIKGHHDKYKESYGQKRYDIDAVVLQSVKMPSVGVQILDLPVSNGKLNC